MRLHANIAPVIATGVALIGLAGAVANMPHPDALPAVAVPDNVPAFKGALSYGKYSLDMCRDSVRAGAWDAKVWIVDPATYNGGSDDDGGIQSILRDSVKNDQLDYVLFVQGGHVEVADSDGGFDKYVAEVTANCVYVSGIGAQGDGVALTSGVADRPLQFRFASSGSGSQNVNPVQRHDIVWRDTRLWSDRFFNGDSTFGGTSTPAVAVRHAHRWILDHNEFVGGDDQSDLRPTGDAATYEIWHGDGTAQYNIWGPTFDWPSNATLQLISYKIGEGDSLTRVSYVRNYYTYGRYRMPKFSVSTTSGDTAAVTDDWELINNISQDIGPGDRTMGLQGATDADLIGNLIQIGVNVTIGASYQPVEYRRCDTGNPGDEWYASSVYSSNNFFYDASGFEDSTWNIVYTPDVTPYYFNCNRGAGLYPDSLKRASRIQHADTVTAWDVEDLADSLFSGSLYVQVGPRQLSCSGALTDVRDSVADKLIAYYSNNTYLGAAWEDSLDAGWGWVGRDTLLAGSLCTDADSDGMPAAWEAIYGFDDSDPTDAFEDPDGDGWFNLDEWLNPSNPLVNDFGGEVGLTPTFGSGRLIYHVPAKIDTLFHADSSIIRRLPNPDSFRAGGASIRWLNSDSTRFLVATIVETLTGAEHVDSAAADSIATDWSVDVDTLRLRTID